ncbi:hypothetical protein AX14_003075 [Amanita brunnescens Koide BX004]|nr:hypothetical protein AX14_003078 [Amanita brunnescens Koide BX004]KAF8690202.1 hypothetical protein AX14_003075 [Amanita brunnescens Koide BX004]
MNYWKLLKTISTSSLCKKTLPPSLETSHPLLANMVTRWWAQFITDSGNRFLDLFQIFPDFSSHVDPNVLPVTLRHNLIKSCSFTIICVYNPPKTHNSAIHSLFTVLPRFPDALVVQGDFNLHSGIWDPSRVNSPPISVEFFNRLSDENFGLANDDGAPTWTNQRGASSVLDLVFIKDSIATLYPDTFVNLQGRGRSDHALITLVFGSTEHWGRPYIPSGEEEEERFIKDLSDSLINRSMLLDVEEAFELGRRRVHCVVDS